MTLRRFVRFCLCDPVLRPAAFGCGAVVAVLLLSVWGEHADVDRGAFAATYGGALLVVLVLAFVLVALAFVRSCREDP
jgi:hypothetical protein